MDKLYIVIPAYNEKETIKNVIDEWYSVVEKISSESRLLIINDGSSDETYEIMKECVKDKPQFIPLTKENGGHGATVLYGYNYAINEEADYIFQTDADGQTLPEEFWQFWNLRSEYDMIIGNRKSRQDGFSRILITKILKLIIRFCFRVNVPDANTPFRLMKASVLKENIELIPQNFNLSNVIISVIYAKKSLSVKHIPITFKTRQGGVSSVNFGKIVNIGIKAIKDFKLINKTLKKF